MLVLDPEVVKGLQPKPDSAVQRLTPRLIEVLTLIAQGYSNMGIARELNLSEKTVELYISLIYQELQLTGASNMNPRVRATLRYLGETQGDW